MKQVGFFWLFNSLTSRLDQHVTSPWGSSLLSCKYVLRTDSLISRRVSFWSNTKLSPLIFKEMYRGKRREFPIGSWGWKGELTFFFSPSSFPLFNSCTLPPLPVRIRETIPFSLIPISHPTYWFHLFDEKFDFRFFFLRNAPITLGRRHLSDPRMILTTMETPLAHLPRSHPAAVSVTV